MVCVQISVGILSSGKCQFLLYVDCAVSRSAKLPQSSSGNKVRFFHSMLQSSGNDVHGRQSCCCAARQCWIASEFIDGARHTLRAPCADRAEQELHGQSQGLWRESHRPLSSSFGGCQIEGYSLDRCTSRLQLAADQDGKAGQGILIAIRKSLAHYATLWAASDSAVWVKINRRSRGQLPLYIAAVYIPPGGSVQLTSTTLQQRTTP